MSVEFDTDVLTTSELDDQRLFSGVERPTDEGELSDLQKSYCFAQWDRSQPEYVELGNHVSPGWTADWVNGQSQMAVEVTTLRELDDRQRDYLVRLTAVDGLDGSDDGDDEPTVLWQRREVVRCERVDSLIEELLVGFSAESDTSL